MAEPDLNRFAAESVLADNRAAGWNPVGSAAHCKAAEAWLEMVGLPVGSRVVLSVVVYMLSEGLELADDSTVAPVLVIVIVLAGLTADSADKSDLVSKAGTVSQVGLVHAADPAQVGTAADSDCHSRFHLPTYISYKQAYIN